MLRDPAGDAEPNGGAEPNGSAEPVGDPGLDGSAGLAGGGAEPAAEARAPAAPARLTGRLGTGSIVFMVIAAAAPLTVVGGNVPLAIANGPGAGAPVGFALASLILLIFAVGFVTMTPYVRQAGAFYAYATRGLGDRIGMGTAAVALVTYTAIQAGVYGYLGWAVNSVLADFGGPTGTPWWVWSLAAVGVVAFLGYRHIELSSKVLGVALVLEIAVVAVLDAVILGQGGDSGVNADSFTPDAALSGPLGVAVLFALTGFIGFESTAVFRSEARDPDRTIPRATYCAVLVIGAFYTLSCWALVLGAGTDKVSAVAGKSLADGGNMLMDAAGAYVGTALRDVMQVLLLTSLFACVLSFHNVIARYAFTLSGQGSGLPGQGSGTGVLRRLGAVHPRHRSPYVSSLAQTGTAVVLVLLFAALGVEPLVGVFGSMAGVSTVGMVLLMLTTSIAVLAFFARHRDLAAGRTWHTRIAPLLAVAGLLTGLWLVVSNFTLITGGSVGVSVALGAIPFAAFLAGCAGRAYRAMGTR
ncbi:APC family permease [Streptomyces iconiensis]|uniref:APC family permease n=1 Tax=Streptomyces iconiensis TaxID=1384038 RepID=A0ABT6ZU01_9ACTN|nr:APC family permease [Streptomyces iconiensis]MDJ1132116.1 APC family permease [Streptomyces iconiensis]